jgi:hypothetical protein
MANYQELRFRTSLRGSGPSPRIRYIGSVKNPANAPLVAMALNKSLAILHDAMRLTGIDAARYLPRQTTAPEGHPFPPLIPDRDRGNALILWRRSKVSRLTGIFRRNREREAL